jgi:hypothetical protein
MFILLYLGEQSNFNLHHFKIIIQNLLVVTYNTNNKKKKTRVNFPFLFFVRQKYMMIFLIFACWTGEQY